MINCRIQDLHFRTRNTFDHIRNEFSVHGTEMKQLQEDIETECAKNEDLGVDMLETLKKPNLTGNRTDAAVVPKIISQGSKMSFPEEFEDINKGYNESNKVIIDTIKILVVGMSEGVSTMKDYLKKNDKKYTGSSAR